jgi:hypothetical protein
MISICKIEDLSVLVAVAMDCKDSDIREIAIKKFKETIDRLFPADVADNAKNEYVRQAAVKKIRGFFTSAWKSENEKTAKKAVEEITDRKKLVRVALEAPAWQAREAAVKKITDRSVLAYVDKNDWSRNVCEAAAGRNRDMSYLADLAKNAADSVIREAAAGKIRALSVLADVDKNFEDEYVRKNAVKRNWGFFTSTWKSKIPRRALKAVAKITNRKELVQAALEAPVWQARAAAVEKITDQSVLAEIAKNDANGDVRKLATVQAILNSVVFAK